MVRLILATAIAALGSGCAGRGAIEPAKPVRVSVPVAVGCVDGVRPGPVAPLSATHDELTWVALTPKQKAELVAAQALRHQNRGDAIDAATGACR
jgi:hypothetical protein